MLQLLESQIEFIRQSTIRDYEMRGFMAKCLNLGNKTEENASEKEPQESRIISDDTEFSENNGLSLVRPEEYKEIYPEDQRKLVLKQEEEKQRQKAEEAMIRFLSNKKVCLIDANPIGTTKLRKIFPRWAYFTASKVTEEDIPALKEADGICIFTENLDLYSYNHLLQFLPDGVETGTISSYNIHKQMEQICDVIKNY